MNHPTFDQLIQRVENTTGMLHMLCEGLREMMLHGKLDVPAADLYELGVALGRMRSAYESTFKVKSGVVAVQGRQPKPLTPAEQAAEAEVRA